MKLIYVFIGFKFYLSFNLVILNKKNKNSKVSCNFSFMSQLIIIYFVKTKTNPENEKLFIAVIDTYVTSKVRSTDNVSV